MSGLWTEHNTTTNQNFIDTFFPDEGPLRRELYQKHLQFFRAGPGERERAFIAGNRIGKCLIYNEFLDLPDGTSKTIGQLFEQRKPFDVMAWDGHHLVAVRAAAPFEKPGLHDCYRVELNSGESFHCADDHVVLTPDGWQTVRDFLEGAASHLLSTEVRDPTVPPPDARRSWGTPRGYQERYSGGCRHGGGRLPSASAGGPGSPPSPGGAQPRSAPVNSWDGLVSRCASSRPPASARLSIQGAVSLFEALMWRFSAPVWLSSDLPMSVSIPLSPPQRAVAGQAPQSGRVVGLDEYLATPVSLKACPFLLTTNKIKAVYPIGRHKVYDFHVPHYHNYVTQGVVHHNTSTAGGYETALHLTGLYPPWWEGRIFDEPVRWWVAGDTGETVREIIQPVLFGPMSQLGTGLIRGRLIERVTARRGSPEAIETAYVRHTSGGLSSVLFKSYEQGRKSFQGTKMHGIWLDEEPSMAIYSECLLRCAATTPEGKDWGSLLCTFTPILGISAVVLRFLGTNMGQEVRTFADQLARQEQERTLQQGAETISERRDLMGAKPKYKSDDNPLERR